jgi:hypothetical protein
MSFSGTEESGLRRPGTPDPQTLILVYNANAGLLNGALDLLHKTLSPSTYPCRLCAITYGPLGMRARWKAFLESLGPNLVFLHKDEYEGPEPLPAILAGDGSVLVSARDFAAIDSLDALQSALLAALAKR